MKAKILFLFLALYLSAAFAQDIEVKKFEVLEKDQTAALNPRKDINGNACSLVKVALKEPGAEFEGSVMGDVQFTGKEYLVYLPNGTKRLGIKHPDYLPTTVVFADYGTKKVASSTTYELKVKTNKKKAKVDNSKTGMVVFNIKPSNAMLLIDGQVADGSGGAYTLSLPYGTHYYTVKLKDFCITNQPVKIEKNAKNIDVDLTEFFAKLFINCPTEDAELSVNGEKKGVERWESMMIPGIYTIEASKDGCHSQTRQIELKDNDEVTVDFTKLKTITGSLQVDYEPAGADVLLNGEKIGVTPLVLKELPIGDYQVEVKKDYYTTSSFRVKLEEDGFVQEKGKLTLSSFGGLYYFFYNNDNNDEYDSYNETLIDYYRVGVYCGYRGAPGYCERDIVKISMNPVKAIKLLKDGLNKGILKIDDFSISRILKHCGSLSDTDEIISYRLAVATMNNWEDLEVPYVTDNFKLVPLAWHLFYGVGCNKDEEKAKNLMKQACKEYRVSTEDDIDENVIPTGLKYVKEKYRTNLEAKNAYAFPAWYELVNDMGLSEELLYIPDYIRKTAPQLFDKIFKGIGDYMFNTGFYSYE